LFWLNDKSEDFSATWAFLDRRIGEVLKVAGRLGKGVGAAMSLPDRFMAAMTARRDAARRGRGPARSARR
jgi:ubiquinone biosynthesis protein COQ9